MRVPLSLLRELVDLPQDLKGLEDRMNGRISEIEKVHRFPTREQFGGVVLARLVHIEASGESYDQWAAQVGDATVSLVVGRKFGVQAGTAYAAVLAGGTAPDGTTVTETQLEGLSSQGMLLSEASAGVGEDAAHPLAFAPEVADDADPWDTLGCDDVVFEFDLEPNRSDLFSLIGMARDVAAIYGKKLRPPALADAPTTRFSPDELRIALRTPSCTRYAALEVDGLQVGPSPQWLQNAVRKLGMRPINNVVDAANLAMLELGHPMHTFDKHTLKSGEIGLRMAASGETITTLDGVERTLTEECMLVTDGDTPIALAGIMGDAHSEIGGETHDVLIEAAHFDMFTIRRASRRLALRTEASVRFEKGLAPSGVEHAVRRLVYLLQQVGGDALTVGRWADSWPSPPIERVIEFDPEEARARLGMDVPDALIRERFAKLGFTVSDDWAVTVPAFRPDVEIQANLNEEVGRIHGYEHVIAELPTAPLAAPIDNPVFTKGFAARAVLTGLGFDETYLGIWVGREQLDAYGLVEADLLQLKNPLHTHLEFFRPSALPDVVEAVRHNRKSMDALRFFELAKVYRRGSEGQVVERNVLTGAVARAGADANGERFYAARDAALAVLGALGIDATVHVEAAPDWALPHCFHPGRQAVLRGLGQVLGFVGELHPSLTAERDLAEPFSCFVLDFEALLGHRAPLPRFQPPARFPSIEIHVNVECDRKHLAATLLDQVGGVTLEHLVRTGIRDVYAGKGVADGQKRVTLELEFNHPERSLTHAETEVQVHALRGHLESQGLVVAI